MLEGRYEHISKLGEGSFGRVYKARDRFYSEMEPLVKPPSTSGISVQDSENKNPNLVLEENKAEVVKSPFVAIKKLYISEDHDEESYNREINFYKKLKHPNIVRLLNTFKKKNLYLVLEYIETDLAKVIEKGTITQDNIKHYMKQILECVKHIHSNKVMHRDLKPSNLLISQNNTLKCGDFGIARDFPKEGQILTRKVCTRYYLY